MGLMIIQTIIAEPNIDFGEELLRGIWGSELFDFEVVQSTCRMLIYECFCRLA